MSISREDTENLRLETLSINVVHIIMYIDGMFFKNKKDQTVEMTANHREYIKSHLNYINDGLLERIKNKDDKPNDIVEIKNDL